MDFVNGKPVANKKRIAETRERPEPLPTRKRYYSGSFYPRLCLRGGDSNATRPDPYDADTSSAWNESTLEDDSTDEVLDTPPPGPENDMILPTNPGSPLIEDHNIPHIGHFSSPAPMHLRGSDCISGSGIFHVDKPQSLMGAWRHSFVHQFKRPSPAADTTFDGGLLHINTRRAAEFRGRLPPPLRRTHRFLPYPTHENTDWGSRNDCPRSRNPIDLFLSKDSGQTGVESGSRSSAESHSEGKLEPPRLICHRSYSAPGVGQFLSALDIGGDLLPSTKRPVQHSPRNHWSSRLGVTCPNPMLPVPSGIHTDVAQTPNITVTDEAGSAVEWVERLTGATTPGPPMPDATFSVPSSSSKRSEPPTEEELPRKRTKIAHNNKHDRHVQL